MLKALLLSTAALALIAGSADARPQVTVSKDNKFVSAMPGGKVMPPSGTSARYVYATIAKDKEGKYFCCYGNTISGPSSAFGKAYGVAEQFILTNAASITTLFAGVGYVSGTHNVTLTLYADNGSNEPGAMLAQGSGTTDTEFGFCCGITRATIPSTSLAAATPYWVAITASGTDFDAANFQVSNEVSHDVYVAGTSDGGSSWGTSYYVTEYDPAIGVH